MVVVKVFSSGERPAWRRVGDGSELEGAPSVVEAVGVGEVSVATRRLMCRPGGGGRGGSAVLAGRPRCRGWDHAVGRAVVWHTACAAVYSCTGCPPEYV